MKQRAVLFLIATLGLICLATQISAAMGNVSPPTAKAVNNAIISTTGTPTSAVPGNLDDLLAGLKAEGLRLGVHLNPPIYDVIKGSIIVPIVSSDDSATVRSDLLAVVAGTVPLPFVSAIRSDADAATLQDRVFASLAARAKDGFTVVAVPRNFLTGVVTVDVTGDVAKAAAAVAPEFGSQVEVQVSPVTNIREAARS